MLLCEKMENTEAIIIKGCRQYSTYFGYGFNLLFKSENLQPLIDFDSKNRLETSFVAIDAIPFFNQGLNTQLQELYFTRELVKAFVGSHGPRGNEDEISSFENAKIEIPKKIVVTGKWGCGVFNGNPELKFII